MSASPSRDDFPQARTQSSSSLLKQDQGMIISSQSEGFSTLCHPAGYWWMTSLFSADESMMNRVHQHRAHDEQLTFLYPLVSHKSDLFAVRKHNTLTPVAHISFSAASQWAGTGLTTLDSDWPTPPTLRRWEGKHKLLHPPLPTCFTN